MPFVATKGLKTDMKDKNPSAQFVSIALSTSHVNRGYGLETPMADSEQKPPPSELR